MTAASRLRAIYVASDYLLSLAGIIVFSVVRFSFIPDGNETRPLGEWLFHDTSVVTGFAVYPIANVILFAISGYYNDVTAKSRFEDIRNALGISLITTLVVFFISLINDYIPDRTSNYRLLLILWSCLSLPPMAGRLTINRFRRHSLRDSNGFHPTIIIGSGPSAQKMRDRLSSNRLGAIPFYNIVGTVDPSMPIEEIRRHIARANVNNVIITNNPDGMEATVRLINALYPSDVSIHLSVDLYNLLTSRTHLRNITSEPLINITSANLAPSTMNIKRLCDIIAASAALVVLLPAYAAIAAAIRMQSPGPVFYRQQRIGYHKKKFDIIKFRTMTTDAEAAGPSLSSEDDPRVTPVGRFLRKYRLDELPQFWNVVRGDMSIVGPRPEREYYISQIVERVPQYSLIHQVRPGITSLGMIKYGYARNVDQMVERLVYDIMYLENISMTLDLKIIFHTVRTVVTGRGM